MGKFYFEKCDKKKFITPMCKFSLKVKFWGVISAKYKTNLVDCIGSMNVATYVDQILENKVFPLSYADTNILL